MYAATTSSGSAVFAATMRGKTGLVFGGNPQSDEPAPLLAEERDLAQIQMLDERRHRVNLRVRRRGATHR